MILEQWLLTVSQSSQPSQVGNLYTVGLNNVGQLGNNSVTFSNSFAQIGTLSWSSISTGISHTVAIRSDGLLYTWGANLYGALGLNDSLRDNNRSSPVQIGSSSWSQVSATGFHTVALTADNKLFAWGLNSSGQLGDNTVNNTERVLSYSVLHSSPSKIFHIDYDGRLWAWKYNYVGSLGLNLPGTASATSPTQVPGSWTNVRGTYYTTFFTDANNSLWATGSNGGRFGDNTTINRSSPVMVNVTDEWNEIEGGWTGSILARKSDGTIWSWGAVTNILGVSPAPAGPRSSPIQIGTDSWVIVSASVNHAAAVRSDGALFTWGTNDYGQLGNNSITTVLTPTQVGTSSWNFVFAGARVTYAIRSDGKLFAWGRNDSTVYGVGDGTIIHRSSPVVVGGAAANTSFTFVRGITSDTNLLNSAAIDIDGQLWRWGNRNSAQNISTGGDYSIPTLATTWNGYPSGAGITVTFPEGGYNIFRTNTGLIYSGGTAGIYNTDDLASSRWDIHLLGNSSYRMSPVQIGISSWAQISAGSAHTLAIRSDSTLWAWGTASSGVLGVEGNTYTTPTNRSSPVQVGSDTWKSVSAGLTHSVGITANNELYAWGNNLNYAVGTPISYTSIAAGPFMFLRSDGIIENAFYNNNGQLGINDTTYPYAFRHTALSTTKSWRFIEGNLNSRYAIDSDYKLFAWGLNSSGQLGDNSRVNKSSPVQIGSDSWITISSAGSHVAAIRSDGALFTWGTSTSGAIGDGFTLNRSSPVQIGSDSWSVVSAENQTVMAIRSDGMLFGWGYNDSGKLGNNANTNVSSPVQIGSDSWTSVSTGSNHTLAIKSDGTLWSWGLNFSGQLGDDTTVSRSSPVQVGNTSWYYIKAAESTSFAIRNSDKLLFAWGYNLYRQTADGGAGTTGTNKSSPTQVYSNESFEKVSMTGTYVAGLTTEGKAFIWGNNASGQILNGAIGSYYGTLFQHSLVEEPVKIANGTWNQVSAGSIHSVAINSDNYLYGWGHPAVANPVEFASWTMVTDAGPFNTYSIRSDGLLFVGGSSVPAVPTSPSAVVKQVGTDTWSYVTRGTSAGRFFGIKTDGSMWDGSGQGSDPYPSLTPVGVGSSWKSVLVQGEVIVAIRSDGGLFTWHPTANNFYGQFGHNTQGSLVTTPTQVGTSSWVFATASNLGRTVIAVTVDGTLWSWGDNSVGQLADNSRVNRSSPVQIPGSWLATSYTLAGTEPNIMFGIKSDYTLWLWGGVASYINSVYRSSPSQIGTSSSWRQVYGKIINPIFYSIDMNYRLYGSGRNDSGQLGTNSTTYASFVEIYGGGSWSFVSAYRPITGIKTDGSLHAWGFTYTIPTDESTAYYPGVSTSKSSPVQIGFGTEYLKSPTQLGSSQWKKIFAGQNYTLGVQSNNILYAWGASYSGSAGHPFVRTTPTPLGYYAISAAAGISHAAALITGNTN